jgi:hypothetical protein
MYGDMHRPSLFASHTASLCPAASPPCLPHPFVTISRASTLFTVDRLHYDVTALYFRPMRWASF